MVEISKLESRAEVEISKLKVEIRRLRQRGYERKYKAKLKANNEYKAKRKAYMSTARSLWRVRPRLRTERASDQSSSRCIEWTMACAWGCLLAWVVQEGGQGTHHDHERDVLKKKRKYNKFNYLDPVLPILLLLLERYSVSS